MNNFTFPHTQVLALIWSKF